MRIGHRMVQEDAFLHGPVGPCGRVTTTTDLDLIKLKAERAANFVDSKNISEKSEKNENVKGNTTTSTAIPLKEENKYVAGYGKFYQDASERAGNSKVWVDEQVERQIQFDLQVSLCLGLGLGLCLCLCLC